MSQKFKLGTLALSVSLALATTTGYAEEEAPKNSADNDERVVVLGSRGAPRSVADSPVPIDLISGDDFVNAADTNLLDTMKNLVPSFNVNTQPISDGATMVRPANMRGLPPDSTLVLVNGKRRHRSAVITFLGAGLSDGSQGPDISVIPSMALSQVEILRDGAAAQYGSDAIAGVMNFVLRDDNSGGTVSARWGTYFDGGGDSARVSGNVGLELGENGFANITYQWKESDATERNIQRDDAAALIAAGNTAVNNPAQVWGAPNIMDDMALFINSGVDLGDDTQIYAFGGFASREVDGGFFFRNPTNRGGVYDGPIDPISGLDTILTGDMTPGATDNSNCPIVTLSADGIPDAAALASLPGANCWAFNLMFPGGFTPRFGGTVEDQSLTAGLKGYFENSIGYDFSVSYGNSEVNYEIRNTINASMGSESPNEFKPGSYINNEVALNADFTQDAGEWTLAYGVEYRKESFEIIAGDAASYEIGPLASQGFGIGSNGFPGFQDIDAGENDRTSKAAYFDATWDVSENAMIAGAVRMEDFSDFGSTFDGKIATQIGMTDEISFRASVSTGFRAPTVGQSNVRNVTTAFDANGGLQDEATLPPTNPVAIQKGAVPLTPEEAQSMSFGFVAEMDGLFATLDFYRINVDDRIGTTSNFALTQTDIDALLASGVTDASSFSSVRYFTNAFSTKTEGVDFVASYSMEHWGGESDLNFVASYNKTDVTDRDASVIGDTRKFQIESTLPKYRNSLSWTHKQDGWSLMTRLNYFGAYTSTHLDAISLLIDVPSEFTLDAAVHVDISDSLKLSLGAQNILNEYPVENQYAGIVGAEYVLTSPMGFAGGYYYAEVTYNF